MKFSITNAGNAVFKLFITKKEISKWNLEIKALLLVKKHE
jgi:hypothetical protein